MTNDIITLSYALASNDFNQGRLVELLNAKITADLENRMLAALQCTDNNRLRNIIAMKIAEDGSPAGKKASVPIIKRLLEEPRTRGCRGTLLYVLHEMQEPLPLSFLLNQISDIGTSYEVQSEAHGIIQENIFLFSSKEIKNSFRIVEEVNVEDNECLSDIIEVLKEEISDRNSGA